MKQEEFRSITVERYLFHLHTRYTDGHLDAIDYFKFAEENNIKSIFFTEHVRRELRYSFEDFISEIRSVEAGFPGIKGFIGAEAKLLPGGGLDIDASTFELLDVLCFACHGFPDDIELYFESFRKLFADEQWKSKVRVFVHPGRYLLKRDWLTEENKARLEELLLFAVENGVIIEDNKRENLPPNINAIPLNMRVIGYDIHHAKGLEHWLSEQ